MDIHISQAISDDALAIAMLHADSWRAHYVGILPADYLANEACAERAAYWTSALRADDYFLVLLARHEDEPVAFIAVKRNVDDGYDATIEHLHVAQSMKGRGLGRQLIGQTAHQLADCGVKSVCLWVFEDNRPAIGFYESLGGVTDAHGTDKFAGGDARDRRIGWKDLGALLAASTEGVKS
ncbi:MAG: GNAT family N-acetyltransferase [Hyphomicrobiales bacterium]|nr:GNAT family N-acetyltransferase [Hyphomicrobiales bacterium]